MFLHQKQSKNTQLGFFRFLKIPEFADMSEHVRTSRKMLN